MPRGNGTGPEGMGPMTGRGAGFCSGADSPGYMNVGRAGMGGLGNRRFFGRGYRRTGYGRGFAPVSYAAPVYSPEVEQKNLENEISFLKNQVKSLEDRLANIKEEE
ncbi:MAG: DUF5320 domain-containing protein [Sphaerochaetaceae bacterium]|nr:DUF5320 domain-containing protein [Sphaerochaetaceae bacterium]